MRLFLHAVKTTVLTAAVLVGGLQVAHAITTTGTISGAVVDPTGLPVEAATVELTSPSLIGKSRVVKTSPEGEFRVMDLPPGL